VAPPVVEFWSSVELGAFARGLMRELGAQGIRATHRFEVADARYRGARTDVDRLLMRWHSYATYPALLARRLRQPQVPQVVVVCTNTFYAPALAVRAAAARGIPIVNWVFDLFPDVLVESGKIARGGLQERALGWVTRWTQRKAAANVFLGEHLRAYAEFRYGQAAGGVVIPIGADSLTIAAGAPVARAAGAPVRLLYCGNLGHMHDIDTVIPAVREPGPPGWTLEFRGHGSGLRKLSALAGSEARRARVTFGDSLPDDEWARVMRTADVALVTMKAGAENLVMPSKTYSAMMAGQAVLAICPPASDLAHTILRDEAGWVVAPGDSAGLRSLLERLAAAPDEVLAMRRNAYQAARRDYDQAALAPRWAELIRSLRRR